MAERIDEIEARLLEELASIVESICTDNVDAEGGDGEVRIEVRAKRIYDGANAYVMLRLLGEITIKTFSGADNIAFLPRSITTDYAEAWALWHGRKLALVRVECEDGECVLSIEFNEKETFALEQALHELATSAEYYGWGRG